MRYADADIRQVMSTNSVERFTPPDAIRRDLSMLAPFLQPAARVRDELM